MTGASDSAARMRERLEEDARALALAERRAEHLGFLDSQYRDGSPGDVLGALRDRLSDEEVLAPAGIGGHSDHELVRDAALELGREVRLFGDLPYSTQWGWPAWMIGEEPDPLRDVDAYWAQFVPEGYEPHPVELGEEEQQAKVEAMRAYATQFSIFEAGALQRLTDPQLLRFEVVWTRRGLE